MPYIDGTYIFTGEAPRHTLDDFKEGETVCDCLSLATHFHEGREGSGFWCKEHAPVDAEPVGNYDFGGLY